ncbi:unnamed protein product [Caenorhabditis nigoni]
MITLFYCSHVTLLESDLWIPPVQCTESKITPNYLLKFIDFFWMSADFSLQVFNVTDGTVKIITITLIPVLTILLVQQLKNTKNSKNLIGRTEEMYFLVESHTVPGDTKTSKTDQTTKMVMLMTVAFIISEGPLGIIYIIQGFVTEPPEVLRPPGSYATKLFGFWSSAFEDHTRRLSSLFGVMMALTRCLIIKNALNPKFEFFSKPLYALLSMLVAFVLSTILTILFWSRYELVEVKAWTPPVECIGFPPGYTVPRYKSSMDDAWLQKPMLSLQIFSVIDGLIKIIPTLMFPILTIILVRELKKAAASRRAASVGSEKHEENSKSHQATKLVILMTITYMAAEGPLGIIYVVQGFVTQPPGIVEMTMDLIDIFGVFVSINAIMHCIICLTVSSQYQKSAKSLFCCVKCLAGRKTKPIPKVSVSSVGQLRKITEAEK